jgi:hypothetical protein
MYCPQCGTESPAVLQYCRVCGSNLKVIGKAVALSEAIGRSDRGPLPKIKEMVKSLKVEHVTEEVSKALEKMNHEIAEMAPPPAKQARPFIEFRKRKTPEERREANITKGVVSLFSGVGLMIFLYYLSAAMILKLPPDVIAKVPFEIEPVMRIIWLFGLLPTLSGVGHIIAGLLIRPQRFHQLETSDLPDHRITSGAMPNTSPASVTENTTNLLEPDSIRMN